MGDGSSVPRMPCQFSPMPVPCIRPLMEAGVLTQQGAVYLLLLLHRFAGKGGAMWSSYPTSRMAEELGITVGSVNQAVKKLVRKGFLRTVVMGYRGKASVYEIDIEKYSEKVGPEDPANKCLVGPTDPKGRSHGNQRWVPETYPTRTSKELVKTAPEGPALAGPAPGAGPGATHVTRKPPNTLTVEEWERMRREGAL